MTHSESWNAFIDELRTCVREHHHFPNKHTNLLSKVKYVRKKINDGTLEEWKKEAVSGNSRYAGYGGAYRGKE